MSTSLQPHGLYPARLLCPWYSPGKNTGVDCHFLLWGILQTQGSNPCLLHCRWDLHWVSHQWGLRQGNYIFPLVLKKNLRANVGDTGLIPGSERSPGGGHGNTLQYTCLENPMDRGTWRAIVHRVAKIWIQPKWLSTTPLNWLLS